MLRPTFFFTDKDSSQMKTIRSVFHLNPTLCLWYIKRAAIKRIKELKKECPGITETTQKDVLNLMTKHYGKYPYFSFDIIGMNFHQLQSLFIFDVKMFPNASSLSKLKNYIPTK